MNPHELVVIGALVAFALMSGLIQWLRTRKIQPDPDRTTYISRHDQNYTAMERRRDWT